MIITFIPQRRDDALTAYRNGDALIINGAGFDFSSVPDGGMIHADDIPCEWITRPVQRIGGELLVSIILPVPADAPASMVNHAPLVDPPNGLLPIPVAPIMEVTEVADVDA